MRRKTTTADVAARLFGRYSTTVVEAPARRAGEAAWHRIPPLARVVGFEPDRGEYDRLCRLSAPGSGERFVAAALGDHDGSATRHLAEEPALSSLLPPDPAAARRFPLLRGTTSSQTSSVRLVRLDGWAREGGCDEIAFIKLDARGAELGALRGAGSALDGCLGLEVGVGFLPVYQGQPAFSDVEQFLRERGFVLWRLSALEHVSERHTERLSRGEVALYNGVAAPSMAGSGRLYRGQALFFRDHASLPLADREAARRLLTLASLLDAAGDLDGLAACLRRAVAAPREAVGDGDRQALSAHLREVEREL